MTANEGMQRSRALDKQHLAIRRDHMGFTSRPFRLPLSIAPAADLFGADRSGSPLLARHLPRQSAFRGNPECATRPRLAGPPVLAAAGRPPWIHVSGDATRTSASH